MPGNRKQGRPKGQPTVVVSARIPEGLAEALAAHVKSVKPKTTDGAVIQLALEEYLGRVADYVPPDDD